VGVVDDPVEYCVCECRFADDVVPCLDRQLAGEQDRAVAVAVLDDLHEVASLRAGEPVRAPVVEDQQIGADELPEQAREAAIAMGEFEFGEEPWQTTIENGPAIATGFLSEGAGEPCLADTAGAGDDQVLSFCDPVALRELAEQVPVELSRRAIVDVLDGSTDMTQFRGPHPGLIALGAAVRRLAIDQQAEPFGMAERRGIGLLREFGECVRHAVELEVTQPLVCGVVEHARVLSQWKYLAPRMLGWVIAGPSTVSRGRRRCRLFFRMDLTEL